MVYKPISDYALIGDMHSAAAVALDGSIDWLCFPRFDSPSVFAALLDDQKGGRFRIRPTGAHEVDQRYLPETNVLSTTFSTAGGRVELVDFMPIEDDARRSEHQLLRVLRGLDGSVEMEVLFEPRLDYARGTTQLRRAPHGVVAEKDEARLALASPAELEIDGGVASAALTVAEREEHAFHLQWGVDAPSLALGWREQLDFTVQEWRGVSASVVYEGRWRDEIVRSLLILHMLLYIPSGALVAAATTSLPEWVGGDRNWDYRFCWIRDAAFTLDAFDRVRHSGETAEFFQWLTEFCESCGDRLQPVYGVRYEEELGEFTLEHLEGYEGSRPVRIGNAANRQLQLDIFGEIMVAIATYHREGGRISDRMWTAIESFVDAVLNHWRRPDRGMWEVRGEQRHFVHSKVMCWLCLDRAVAIAEALGKDADLDRWRRVAEEIRAEVLSRGWDEELGSFVQSYGAKHTDASLLMLPMVGFIDAEDPKMRSTVQRIRAELEDNGLLRRYDPRKTDDGFRGEEGAFTMCTLWLAGDLAATGEVEEAQRLFERVLACGNHVGIFSEMIDPATGRILGNFPQAFTHVSLIHTARNLHAALEGRATREEARVGGERPTKGPAS